MKSHFVAPLLLVLPFTSQAQVSSQGSAREQSHFTAEQVPGEPRVEHPVVLPYGALEALKSDTAVKSCLQYNKLDTGQSLGAWFVASAIHLDGPMDSDLVVVPKLQGQQSMCFETPTGIGLFWILRGRSKGYQLVLRTWGGGLEILSTKTNGLRDIITGSLGQAGTGLTNVTFQFDGTRYVKASDRTHNLRQ